MKSKVISAIVLAALLLPGIDVAAQDDWANLKRYEKANSEVTVRPKAVFMGDSITQGWYETDSGFFIDHNFLCRGISGQTTSPISCLCVKSQRQTRSNRSSAPSCLPRDIPGGRR